MNELVSVIVPIYNVEDYLTDCVDSIIAQSYRNIEIILVNDGSPDGCLELCRHYSQIDERVVVVDKENGGLGSARNAGIEVMSGQYVAFIDSDDYIHPTMIEELLGCINEHDADIAVCDFFIFDESGIRQSDSYCRGEIRAYSPEEALYEMFWPNRIRWSACNKLYKASLFESVRYAEGVFSEDMATTYLLYSKAQKTVWLGLPLYYYRIRESGIIQAKSTKRYADEVNTIERICTFFSEEYPNLVPVAQAFYGKIALNNMIGLTPDVSYATERAKCVNALRAFGPKALAADFVKSKYKVAIALALLFIKPTRGRVANTKPFIWLCGRLTPFLK